MRVIPAIDGLTEFRPDGSVAMAAQPADLEGKPDPAAVIELPADQMEPANRNALDAAVMAARQETEALWQDRLEQARKAAEDLLERERSSSSKAGTDAIAAGIAEEFKQLRSQLAQQIFAQCRPVLSLLSHERAMDELEQVIDVIVDGNCRLRIAGPQALLDGLRPRIENRSIEIDWCADDTVDVSITAGDTVVMTRLIEWLDENTRGCDE